MHKVAAPAKALPSPGVITNWGPPTIYQTFTSGELNRTLFDVEVNCWGGGNSELNGPGGRPRVAGGPKNALGGRAGASASQALLKPRCTCPSCLSGRCMQATGACKHTHKGLGIGAQRQVAESPLPSTCACCLRPLPADEQQCYADRPENLRVESGRLVLQAVRGSWTGVPPEQGGFSRATAEPALNVSGAGRRADRQAGV